MKLPALKRQTVFKVGLGIPCYKEALTLGPLLARVAAWEPQLGLISRLYVVCDDSTDGTLEIAKKFSAAAPFPVTVHPNPTRGGKGHAINQILAGLPDAEIVFLMSGDILPEAGCLEKLLAAFQDPKVGVAGGRVVPVGPSGNWVVELSLFHWDMHHELAMEAPKTTEITALRRMDLKLKDTELVDEADLERQAVAKGYEVRYVPEAVIRSASPLSLKDYWTQRLRVTVGHLELRSQTGFSIGTLSWKARARALFRVMKNDSPRLSIVLAGILVECGILLAARIRMLHHSNQPKPWKRIDSAKRPLEDIDRPDE